MVNEQAAGASVPGDPSPSPGELPPGYVWAYHVPVPEQPRWKPPRWLIIVAILWGAALLASGVVYALHGKPTVRGQTTIVGAEPVVDRAIRDVAAAAGPGPIVAVGGFTKVDGCHITPVRSGVEYQRTIMLYDTPGTESTLLATIAHGLPASYQAKSGPGAILDLYADAGDYVGITGAAPAPGQIEVRAATGCRETGGTIRTQTAPALDTPEMAPVRTVLAALGVRPASTSAAEVACASGAGAMRTVAAHVAPSQVPGPLGTVLTSLTHTPAAAGPNVFAYRSGATDVVATQDSSGLTVSATTRC